MCNRKKARVEKINNYFTKLLEDLRSRAQIGKLSIDLQSIHSELVGMLLKDNISAELIESIAEMFRIAAPHNVLGNVELDLFFNGILRLLTTTLMRLDTLVKYRIPALLKNKKIINKYVKMVGKTLLNKQYLDDIVVILIEESGIGVSIIKSLFDCLEAAKNILQRKSNMIPLDELSDEKYVEIYCNILEGVYTGPIRLVKGPERRKYIKLAIIMNNDEISEAYHNDRDIRVRIIIAEKCKSPQIFEIMVHDENEKVRKMALRRLHWADIKKYKIYDRILDKSYDVRQEIYRIYREGLVCLAKSWLFNSESKIKLRKESLKQIINLNFKFINDEKYFNEFKMEEDIEVMINFVNKLCEGCASIVSDEYLYIIAESKLSMEFLFKLKENNFAYILFQNLEIDFIDERYADFCLEYFYRKELEEYQIQKYLEENCFSVIKFIKDTSKYNSILIEKACSLKDRKTYEKIIENIIPWLQTKYLILKNKGKVIILNNINFVIKEKIIYFENNLNEIIDLENSSYNKKFNDKSKKLDESIENIDKTDKKEILTHQIIELLFETPNLLLVNTHTRWGDKYIIHFLVNSINLKKTSYEFFYFLMHKKICDQKICEIIYNYNFEINDLINLLLYLDNPDILYFFSKQLLGCYINYETLQKINLKGTRTGFIIYFLSSGAVNCKSTDFFLNIIFVAIHSCDKLNLTEKEKLKNIFKKYITMIPQSNYDIIYTIVHVLKGYFVKDIQKSDNNKSVSQYQKYNENIKANKSNNNFIKENLINKNCFPILKKNKLSFCNKVLYFICDFIISLRKGVLKDLNLNFEIYGFYKLN